MHATGDTPHLTTQALVYHKCASPACYTLLIPKAQCAPLPPCCTTWDTKVLHDSCSMTQFPVAWISCTIEVYCRHRQMGNSGCNIPAWMLCGIPSSFQATGFLSHTGCAVLPCLHGWRHAAEAGGRSRSPEGWHQKTKVGMTPRSGALISWGGHI